MFQLQWLFIIQLSPWGRVFLECLESTEISKKMLLTLFSEVYTFDAVKNNSVHFPSLGSNCLRYSLTL
jgi:hypothetical protein